MRIIYIDKDYMCHISDGKGLRPIENDFFDGKVDEFIEGYRFIPEGETWVRDDGMEFTGQMISPVKDYGELERVQRTDEMVALGMLGIIGVEPPSVTAQEISEAIDSVVEFIPDDKLENIAILFKVWSGGGVKYAIDTIVRYANALYRCLQAHTSQEDWTPAAASSLWVRTANPLDEYPEWIQPTGAHNAYKKGDKVTFSVKRYISKIDSNIWSPDVYPQGWEEIK